VNSRSDSQARQKAAEAWYDWQSGIDSEPWESSEDRDACLDAANTLIDAYLRVLAEVPPAGAVEAAWGIRWDSATCRYESPCGSFDDFRTAAVSAAFAALIKEGR
jgi:hypothetical protein